MTSNPSVAAIVLAAGEGTRMHSPLPKVVHPVGGRTMLGHVLAAVAGMRTAPSPVVVVVGRAPETVRAAVAADAPPELGDRVAFVTQTPRLGTGHAVLQARAQVAGRAAAVVVLYGDVPLIRSATLDRVVGAHVAERPAGPAVTMLTALVDDPSGYGRVIRTSPAAGAAAMGAVVRVVEERDATDAERAVREINTGLYVFDDRWLWPALAELRPAAGGEIYLTDLIERAVTAGRTIAAVVAEDPTEVAGVNTPAELARVEATLEARGTVPLAAGHAWAAGP